MTTRKEHLDWCKQRALEYVEQGDLKGAIASMVSDLGKHEKTCDHQATALMVMMSSTLNTKDKMEEFIKGFN